MGRLGRERWVVSLLVLAAVVGVTQCSFHQGYRATATLILLPPPELRSGVQLIPNAPTSPSPISDALTRAVDQPDVARAVVAAGGSPHFKVHAGTGAHIDIAVTPFGESKRPRPWTFRRPAPTETRVRADLLRCSRSAALHDRRGDVQARVGDAHRVGSGTSGLQFDDRDIAGPAALLPDPFGLPTNAS